MRRISSILGAVVIGLAASALLTGCGCIHQVFHKTDKKAAKAAESQAKYEALAAKANAGDSDAARDLAKWCYTHDDDSTRAKQWLEVAARNGDSGAQRIAEHVQTWQ